MTIRLFAPVILAACLGWAASAPAASTASPDWAAVGDVREVEVITADADGEPRETTIWFAVHQGVAYIRTSGGSTWGDNVERGPEIVLRVEGTEYPLRAEPVTDAALLEQVHATFREKYGWFDGFAGVIRGSSPRIMQLGPRDPASLAD